MVTSFQLYWPRAQAAQSLLRCCCKPGRASTRVAWPSTPASSPAASTLRCKAGSPDEIAGQIDSIRRSSPGSGHIHFSPRRPGAEPQGRGGAAARAALFAHRRQRVAGRQAVIQAVACSPARIARVPSIATAQPRHIAVHQVAHQALVEPALGSRRGWCRARIEVVRRVEHP